MALRKAGTSSSTAAGFTLLELLLAVTILAIVMSVVFTSFSGSFRTFDVIEGKSMMYQVARATMDRFTEELNSCYISTSQQGNVLTRGLFRGKDSRDGDMDTDTIEFTSNTSLKYPKAFSEAGMNQTAIRYIPEAGETRDEIYLMRYETMFATCQSFNPMEVMLEPTRFGNLYVVAKGNINENRSNGFSLVGFNLQYKNADMDLWADEWDACQGLTPGLLPTAVKIELFFMDYLGAVHHFVTSVEIPPRT